MVIGSDMTVENDDHFPYLKAKGWRQTSKATAVYNCIAYAAGDESALWWPESLDAYWPEGATGEETVAAVAAAFGTLGYYPCDDGTFEDGYEKVAIYALRSEATHAAKQVGREWRSKLGPDEDIAHTLEGLEGPCYGKVAAYLKRPTSKPDIK